MNTDKKLNWILFLLVIVILLQSVMFLYLKAQLERVNELVRSYGGSIYSVTQGAETKANAAVRLLEEAYGLEAPTD